MLQLDRNYLQHVSRPFHRKSASLPVHRFAPRSPNVNRLPRRSVAPERRGEEDLLGPRYPLSERLAHRVPEDLVAGVVDRIRANETDLLHELR